MTLAIRRRLTDPERRVLSRLSIETVVGQTGASWEEAVAALEQFADEGKVEIVGDNIDTWLVVAGKPIVHISREDLALAALDEAEGDR
jgi:hypothetical protein